MKDLYDVTGCAVNVKTGGLKPVINKHDVGASKLLKTCENICNFNEWEEYVS